MRIHTNVLAATDIDNAARETGVDVLGLTSHGSRKRARAFEVQLSGSSPHRSQYGDRSDYAASWDEWGIFLGKLFTLDPNVTIPRVYDDASDFSYKTGGEYDGGSLDREPHKRHSWEIDVPFTQTCKCGAVRRWR